MPQAATPKEPTAEEKAKAQAEQEMKDLIAEATEGDNAGARQIKRAIQLEREISKVRGQVNANRDYLRLMAKNDELTEAQADFVETFYAEKERGVSRDAADVEATRKLKEFTRRDGVAS